MGHYILSQTLEAATMRDAGTLRDLGCMVIDSTAREEAMAYPTYILLLEFARGNLEGHTITTAIRTIFERAQRLKK